MANQMLVVPCTLYWTNPHRQDKYGFVSGTFGNLDADTVKTLKAAGLKVKFDAENDENEEGHMGFYIKARSDTAVPCMDTQKKRLPETFLLGNGTKAEVVVEAKDWVSKQRGTSGTKALFRALKVLEHVSYDPDASAKAKAEALLDGTSGGGFVFGGDDAPSDNRSDAETEEDFNRLFGDEA